MPGAEGESEMTELEELLQAVKPLNEAAQKAAKDRWAQVAKPLHSLGLLEEAVIKIAGISGTFAVRIDKKALVIMCADNGIVEEGVTQTGQEVTAVVTENFTRGEACVCLMAEQAGVDVYPVDIGVASELSETGRKYPLIRRKISMGTKNFLREPAMTRKETESAILEGIRLAKELKHQGYGIIATGEMGIGNTTTSSAAASVLLDLPPEQITGKGAGLSDLGLQRKIQVISEAIRIHKPDRMDGIDVLSKVGGLDLAGLAGIFLGGALYGVPVVVDGVISATAALAAAVICPEAKSYMIASHASAEPAGRCLLDALGLEAVIYGGMFLGEGTGAVALMPLLDMAVTVYNKMSTFQEIEIEEYHDL